MARLRSKGSSATRLVRDDDSEPLPIMPWGTRAQSDAHGGDRRAQHDRDLGRLRRGQHRCDRWAGPLQAGRFQRHCDRQRTYLPEGVWHELPIFEGSSGTMCQ